MRAGAELQPGMPHGSLPGQAHSGFTKIAGKKNMITGEFFRMSSIEILEADVEQKARDTDCCKVTLEVQQNNHRAQRIYETAGFSRSVYVEAAGSALFLSKPL